MQNSKTKTNTNSNPDPNRYRRRCPDPNARIQKFIHYMATTPQLQNSMWIEFSHTHLHTTPDFNQWKLESIIMNTALFIFVIYMRYTRFTIIQLCYTDKGKDVIKVIWTAVPNSTTWHVHTAVADLKLKLTPTLALTLTDTGGAVLTYNARIQKFYALHGNNTIRNPLLS